MIHLNSHFMDKTSNYLQYFQAVITMQIQNEDAFNQKYATMLASINNPSDTVTQFANANLSGTCLGYQSAKVCDL